MNIFILTTPTHFDIDEVFFLFFLPAVAALTAKSQITR